METSQLFFYDDISEGMTGEREYVVTRAVYENFLQTFGDCGPLHLEGNYAEQCGFENTVMHGAILNGFISNFVGMVLPGGRSLELSVEIRFSQPVYLGDTLRLQGKVVQKLEVMNVVVLHLTFLNQTRKNAAATARVQVKMMTT